MSMCPGQDMRNLKAAIYKCPKCGAEVEMFSDELRIKCPKCGGYVYQEKLPSCSAWCASARRCLGEERWRALRGEDAENATEVSHESESRQSEENW